jgi:membrane fusion protein, multidrug efflux system
MKRTIARLLKQLLAVVLVGAAIYGSVVWLTRSPQTQQRQGGRFGGSDGPVPVLAATAQRADVPVYLDGVGTVRALNTVTVRSQVNGTLLSVKFREGQDVKRGDVLAQVDPATYKAQLDQAIAQKALDEALLANAKVDLERYGNLVKTNAVTKQQYDTQKALVDQYDAKVRIDQGAIDNARAYVDWCTITSPIDGRTGLRQVDAGNVVSSSDATGIVVVSQLRPINVLFNLPQQQLGTVNKASAEAPLAVQATSSDARTVLDSGTLTVINNQVDQTTGTVQLKAEFPNAQLQLWPGQFVNIRLLVDTLRQVVVVPTAAVQRGPNGTFVFLVTPENTVTVRAITVTQQNEMQAVVASGLAPSDRVVTTGFNQLAEGRRISVASADARSPAAAAPAAGADEGKAGDAAAGPERSRRSTGERPADGDRPAGDRQERRRGQANPAASATQ